MFGLLSKDKDRKTGSSEVYEMCSFLEICVLAICPTLNCEANFLFVNYQNKPKIYLHVSNRRVSEFLLQSATRWTFHGKRYLKGVACCDLNSVIQTQGHVVSNGAGLHESLHLHLLCFSCKAQT